MSANVVSLVPRLPVRSALDVAKVEAGDGVVFETVTDGNGDPVELSLTPAEARVRAGLLLDAADVAEAIERG